MPTSSCTSIGNDDRLKLAARRLIEDAIADGESLCTDAEVFQELLHRHLSIKRREAIAPAYESLLELVGA